MSFWRTVLDASASLDQRSYYELLGVPGDASGDHIMARFYELTVKLHPDRHARERDPERRDALTRVYARLNEGVKVLSVPAQRQAYDRGLREGRTRMDPERRPNSGPRETRDPKTEAGRKLLQRALGMIKANDRRGARAQLQLAQQMEPDSEAIATVIRELEASEAARRKRAAPKPVQPAAPAAAPASTPPAAPAAAPASTPPAAPAPTASAAQRRASAPAATPRSAAAPVQTPVSAPVQASSPASPPVPRPAPAPASAPQAAARAAAAVRAPAPARPPPTAEAAEAELAAGSAPAASRPPATAPSPARAPTERPAAEAPPPHTIARSSPPEPPPGQPATSRDAAPARRRQRRSSGPKLARAHTRYPSAVPVRLRIAGWQRFETLVAKDISRGGMFLGTDKPLAVGQPVALTLALPDGQSLELEAVVARAVAPGSGATPGMGLRFAEMPTSTQLELRALVTTHAQQPPAEVAVASPGFEQLVAELARVQASGLHQIFGLGTDATLDDLNRAYRDRVTRFHPRHFGGAEQSRAKEAALELMVCLRRSRDQLRDLIAAPAAEEEWRPEDTGVRLARQARERRSALRPHEPPIETRRLLDGKLFDDNAVTETERLASHARQLIERGDFARARAELEDALTAAPREPRLLAGYFLAAGYAAKQAGDADQALRYFRQALAYDPHCAEAIAELRS